jgi:hypothetical protein
MLTLTHPVLRVMSRSHKDRLLDIRAGEEEALILDSRRSKNG